MNTVLFWFRNDLRLHDQRALQAALDAPASALLPVVCLPRAQPPLRLCPHRKPLARQGQRLLVCQADPSLALPALARAVGGCQGGV